MARILIVDDDPDIVEGMKTVLESKKYDITTASSAAEGLKLAKEIKPDVIILDVMMESKDSGFNLAREYKNDENLQHTRILMLTAIKQETGLDFKNEAGDEEWLPVDDYCDKPLNPDELLSKVEALLHK